MSRSSVVLPQPDGPSSVKSSPSPMSRDTRSTAVVVSKRFVTSLSAMIIVLRGDRRASPLKLPCSAVATHRSLLMGCPPQTPLLSRGHSPFTAQTPLLSRGHSPSLLELPCSAVATHRHGFFHTASMSERNFVFSASERLVATASSY